MKRTYRTIGLGLAAIALSSATPAYAYSFGPGVLSKISLYCRTLFGTTNPWQIADQFCGV